MAQLNISRRTLLLGGGTAAAALTGGLFAARFSGAGWITDPGAEPDSPLVGAFDTRTDQQLLAPTSLMNTTVPQSFAFDDARGDVYAVQLVQGGLRLRGEDRQLPSDQRAAEGDMCVTRLPAPGTGDPQFMYLRGFGHGVSIGVQPHRSGVWIWTESDADPANGYGRAVARVPFREGTTLDSADPSVVHHRVSPGSQANQPVLDMAGGRVMVSYWPADDPSRQYYSVYRTEDFVAGRYTELYKVRQVGRKDSETFQGCALYGDVVYQLAGNSYTAKSGDNPRSRGGNTRLTAIDLTTGRPAGRATLTAGRELPYREPEGLSVRLTDPPRLCVGFGTGEAGGRMLAIHSFGHR
ncbi:signaling protein [Streptomyces sp. NBC_00454]|uniref:phage baseplate protein n=1 Tax=Streptomyces sp. NBC_00454 TaxID=2975747 RepID=UPI0030E0DB8D